MKKLCFGLALLAALAAGVPSRAVDAVKIAGATISGSITKMSPTEVVVEANTVARTVPVNEIESILYDGEPALLKSARQAVNSSQYQDALSALERIRPEDQTRPVIKQDVDFYKALCAARLAAADAAVIEAGKKMQAFLTANAGSYHYWRGCEVMADLSLSLATPAYQAAETWYKRLEAAPWPDYKMRAGVAVGWAQLAQGKPADAAKSFEAVLGVDAPGDLADRQRLLAGLGKARCLTEEGKFDEAIKLIEPVIQRADLVEQSELMARGYNALGAAHRKAGRTKDALLAFLHTDILYNRSARPHIEALENLVELWTQVQKPERAQQAAEILGTQYNRRVAGG